MDDLNRVLMNAGLPIIADSKKTITESKIESCGCGPDCKCGGKCGAKCGSKGCCCDCGERTGNRNMNECSASISESSKTTINNAQQSHKYDEKYEMYKESFDAFMEADIEESAGVGILTKQNSTVDVKPGTLKKNGKQMGFDITDGGIPPRVSKDSSNS